MILTCIACHTRYLVNPVAIGPAGRYVRCANCGHTWFQERPAEALLQEAGRLTPPNPAEASSTRPASKSPEEPSTQPSSATRNDAFRSGNRLPAVIHPQTERRRLNWRLIIPLVILTLTAVFLLGQGWITDRWPASLSLYQALGL